MASSQGPNTEQVKPVEGLLHRIRIDATADTAAECDEVLGRLAFMIRAQAINASMDEPDDSLCRDICNLEITDVVIERRVLEDETFYGGRIVLTPLTADSE